MLIREAVAFVAAGMEEKCVISRETEIEKPDSQLFVLQDSLEIKDKLLVDR